MCNINSLFVKNKQKPITSFLMASSSHSFASNSHGEGIYTNSNNKVIKSLNKIDFSSLSNDIENSDVIITHQRWSTSGFEVEFNHPFENESFILVHNGVINQFKEDIKK
jgi:predicted glutamine amidotransferase